MTTELETEVAQLKAQLEEEERKTKALQDEYQRISSRTMASQTQIMKDQLANEKDQLDKQAKALVDRFLKNEVTTDEFLSRFLELRTQYHQDAMFIGSKK